MWVVEFWLEVRNMVEEVVLVKVMLVCLRTRRGNRHFLYMSTRLAVIVKVFKFGVVRGYHG